MAEKCAQGLNACSARECTRVRPSAGWPGRARVVSSRLLYWQTLATMRAPHSPFDLLAHIDDLPMLWIFLHAWLQIRVFSDWIIQQIWITC